MNASAVRNRKELSLRSPFMAFMGVSTPVLILYFPYVTVLEHNNSKNSFLKQLLWLS